VRIDFTTERAPGIVVDRTTECRLDHDIHVRWLDPETGAYEDYLTAPDATSFWGFSFVPGGRAGSRPSVGANPNCRFCAIAQRKGIKAMSDVLLCNVLFWAALLGYVFAGVVVAGLCVRFRGGAPTARRS
jgi:hypothetical protein